MEIRNFSIKFKNKIILSDFTYCFQPGIIYNIYGRNGAGKSSFAKALAGYIKYTGKSDFENKKVGIVSSYVNIPNELSVRDVIKFLKRQSNLEDFDYRNLYELCHINHFLDRKKISMLSDGEKKKLQIFAALTYKKEVLILDEFLSNLDRTSVTEFRGLIKQLIQKFLFICINITHSIEDARVFQGSILYLSDYTFHEIESTEELEHLL